MNKTKELQLYLPPDKSEEWGYYLNENFVKLDKKVTDNFTVATSQFINSGVYGVITPQDIQVDSNKVEILNLDCYFPALTKNFSSISTLPGTIHQDKITFTIDDSRLDLESEVYGNFYFGLHYSVQGVELKLTKKLQEFKIKDGDDIYLGSIVVMSERQSDGIVTKKFVPELFVFKPWFSNVGNNDRVMDIVSHGQLLDGYIGVQDNYLIPRNEIKWLHEGINYSNEIAPHFLYDFAKKDESGHLLFFRAVDDRKLDISELKLESELDKRYYFNSKQREIQGEKEVVTPGYYTIQRYCVLENGTSVIFYGDKQYENLNDAEMELPFLPDLHTMVLCKEIARIIVCNDLETPSIVYNLQEMTHELQVPIFDTQYFTLYNKQQDGLKIEIPHNEKLNNHTLIIDSYKQKYMVADAAEVRSSGIIPGANTNLTWTHNNFSCQCKYGLVKRNIDTKADSTITYGELNKSVSLSGGEAGWYVVYFSSDANTIQTAIIGSALDVEKNFILGYGYWNKSNFIIQVIAPSILLTDPNMKASFALQPMLVNGGLVTQASGALRINECKVKAEGINYKSLVSPHITGYSAKALQWKYCTPNFKTLSSIVSKLNYNTIADSKDVTSTISSGYSIQKVLLFRNGEVYIVYGAKQYTTKEEAERSLMAATESYTIPADIYTEIARIIVPVNQSTEETKVYYTNNKVLGNIEITTVDASKLDPKYNASEFEVHKDDATTNKIKFDLSQLNDGTAIIKVPSSGEYYLDGIGQYPLTRVSTANNAVVKWNNNSQRYETQTLNIQDINGLQSTINSLTQRIQTLEGLLLGKSKLIQYHVGKHAPVVDDKYSYIWYDTNSTPNFVKFWNGSTWEILNTWQ